MILYKLNNLVQSNKLTLNNTFKFLKMTLKKLNLQSPFKNNLQNNPIYKNILTN